MIRVSTPRNRQIRGRRGRYRASGRTWKQAVLCELHTSKVSRRFQERLRGHLTRQEIFVEIILPAHVSTSPKLRRLAVRTRTPLSSAEATSSQLFLDSALKSSPGTSFVLKISSNTTEAYFAPFSGRTRYRSVNERQWYTRRSIDCLPGAPCVWKNGSDHVPGTRTRQSGAYPSFHSIGDETSRLDHVVGKILVFSR